MFQVRHILQLVADNTGFLVEDRLLKLIEKYQMNSQNLCTLDAIFMVRMYLIQSFIANWLSLRTQSVHLGGFYKELFDSTILVVVTSKVEALAV